MDGSKWVRQEIQMSDSLRWTSDSYRLILGGASDRGSWTRRLSSSFAIGCHWIGHFLVFWPHFTFLTITLNYRFQSNRPITVMSNGMVRNGIMDMFLIHACHSHGSVLLQKKKQTNWLLSSSLLPLTGPSIPFFGSVQSPLTQVLVFYRSSLVPQELTISFLPVQYPVTLHHRSLLPTTALLHPAW